MALAVRIALFLGVLSLYKSHAEGFKINGSQRKEAKYGRPVLAMANSPRCMFNGRPVEDGRTVSSPEPCLNCTCSRGILLCYLRTCTTVIATPGCEVVRKKGECCPKLECKDPSAYRADRISETNYKYRLRQDESNFFGLIGLDPRTEKSNSIKATSTTRRPAPKIDYSQDDWMSSEIHNPSDELQALVEQEEDYESDRLSADKNDSSGYCYHKGYKYKEGMAMLSPTKCEYCYCIRGQQMCVRPKCHLNIDGCVARYQSGYTCCPSHYQCEIGVQEIDTDGYHFASTLKPDQAANKVTSCNVEGYDFDVGVAVPSSGHCQTCYCTQFGVVCRRLECSPSVPGCTPIVPEGHCCPTEYKCDQQSINETQVPISHSTENYDVTIILPVETETASPQTSETETILATDYDYNDNYTSEFYDQETTTDHLSDKQKITVELNEDANLESISVIPEENIAVLVVTTEKTNEKEFPADTTAKQNQEIMPSTYLKEKTKSTTARGASTIIDETHYSQDTTKPIIISLPNLKQKTKPTKGTTLIHGNWYTHITAEPSFINFKQKVTTTAKDNTEIAEEAYNSNDAKKPITISSPDLRHTEKSTTTIFSATTKADTINDGTLLQDLSRNSRPSTESTKHSSTEGSEYKDNYDYVDEYEDGSSNQHETFSPFADYTEPAYGERLTSTEKTTTGEKYRGTTGNVRFKNKNTKPSVVSQTNNAHLSTIPAFTNSKFATEGLSTHKTIETDTYPDRLIRPTDSVTITNQYEDYPTQYTIYSIPSDKTSSQLSTVSADNQKQKLKPNRPDTYQDTKYPFTKDTTSIETTIPEISTKLYQNEKHRTTLDHMSDDYTVTETNKPHLHTNEEPTIITSNHKQKPQRVSHTTVNYKTTQPLPPEIAELLWTITQKHNTQTDVTSTEIYDPSIKQESLTNKISGNSEYSPDNLSLILAAPKLIVEDTTPHENYETMELETTSTDVLTSDYSSSNESSVPNLMFNAPEIIFSNHGPSSHRKQQQPIRDYHIPSLQAVRNPVLPNQQGIKKPSLQTVKNSGLQSVKNSGHQTIKNNGVYGTQVVRDPGVSNIQKIKDSGHSGLITIRDPGLTDIQSIRDTGYPSIQNQKESSFPGHQPNRRPGLPLEINNHKKVLRPRPPSRFRPSPTPSLPQSSVVEISNHRPINNFRRPSTKFPPYPSYNQRSEPEYRSQQKPRDPHYSLHYIGSDLHPEWRDEEYDEYYYDFEQGRPPFKVFTNMQKQQTTYDIDSIENVNLDYQSPNLQKSTRQQNLNLSTTTIEANVDQHEHEDEQEPQTMDFLESIKETISEEIEGRSSDMKVMDSSKITTQTPFFTTSRVTTEHATTPTLLDNKDHLFRVDSHIKSNDEGLNKNSDQFEEETNKFQMNNERLNAEKPILRPIPVLSESPLSTTPTPSEEDSKEISDVCFVDGRYYNSGEIIVKSNPCEMCRCFYGHPLCQVQQCPHPPEPSCVLEYLPGYCCPRVTCGVNMDSSESHDVSAPDPTSQEIKLPLITSDNQWKPLPHGPIVRKPETIHQVITPSPETVPDIVTAPPYITTLKLKIEEEINKETEMGVESSYTRETFNEEDESDSMTTTEVLTTTSTVSPPLPTETTQTTTTTTQKTEITTYFPEITTEPLTETSPIIQQDSEDTGSEQNSSDIHDNSSGVRKVLDETITLPPSKMSLSPNSAENISTVLPVIQTLSPSSTEPAGLDMDTVPNIILGDLPAELGGNLKVSGCNVYGKYYNINDIVTVLSKTCKECVCSPDGIACNATC